MSNNNASIDPPYPSDLEAKGWSLDLDYEKIEQSDTWAIATPEQRPWLLMLWLVAWRQSPVSSLPSNHRLIAARIGMPLTRFEAWAEVLLSGWQLATDGRMYHKTLTQHVLRMAEKRNKDRARVAAFRAKSERVAASNALHETRNEDINDRNSLQTPSNEDVAASNALHTRDSSVSSTPTPTPLPTPLPTEVKEPNNSVPSGTGASDRPAPPDPPAPAPVEPEPIPEEVIFGWGVNLLKSRGMNDKFARSMLGKAKKVLGDIDTLVMLNHIDKKEITDPVTWMAKYINNKPKPGKMTNERGGFIKPSPVGSYGDFDPPDNLFE